jgi:hypothetical protein
MAKARLYVLNGTEPKKPMTGQAKVVFDVMNADRTPRLATEIAESVKESGLLKTRQDILRVTLYYIIAFRNKGLVTATEQQIEAPAEVDEVEETEEVEG